MTSVEHWRFSKASITAYQGPTNILSHGTICASIFSEYAINCDIVDLSVFKECAAHREDIIDSILAALLWCAEHQIDLISMSVIILLLLLIKILNQNYITANDSLNEAIIFFAIDIRLSSLSSSKKVQGKFRAHNFFMSCFLVFEFTFKYPKLSISEGG